MERRQGDPVEGWRVPPRPGPETMEGAWARLERLDPARHAPEIHAANRESDRIWDWLPYGPFDDEAGWRAWADSVAGGEDPFFYAIRDRQTGRAGGVASFLRIVPDHGTIEIGHINLSPALQQTRAATEALCLMMRWAFEAGYRRIEWKCDALNLPSRRAAQRLGLSYEGTFRQHLIVKGRNRDTAWFAATDRDWPGLRSAFEAWLAPANFDADGRQRQALSTLTAPLLVARDPALS
ncbi:Acetyltransferase, including N-acetylase of ribosomal protein [Rubellimicrobium thermophilum DSM 16684]|uniref:Acetyltransferase, including N-acetylase of ribosomal protein n=1 Tax=Rubellimicrobium thermophilum DSM 16684 TaxID=1123069 RepID=S9QW41_9RHOB|nr:GNAT family protein [Rubellimicrobium thermophilum]EPX83802.1 Acetyltransferase, including N-acetylase of ribosomal protein [Rubellimicrobium thermophilum DSM 16684]